MLRKHFFIVMVLASSLSCQQEVPPNSNSEPPRDAQLTNTDEVVRESRQTSGDDQASALPKIALSRKEIESGWIQLFDGESLFGWKPNNDSVNWSVADGLNLERIVYATSHELLAPHYAKLLTESIARRNRARELIAELDGLLAGEPLPALRVATSARPPIRRPRRPSHAA